LQRLYRWLLLVCQRRPSALKRPRRRSSKVLRTVKRGRAGSPASLAISRKEPATGRGSVAFASTGSCTAQSGQAIAGCLAAKARLTSTDVRRKSEPDYRLGWNSYSAPSQKPSLTVAQPATASPSTYAR